MKNGLNERESASVWALICCQTQIHFARLALRCNAARKCILAPESAPAGPKQRAAGKSIERAEAGRSGLGPRCVMLARRIGPFEPCGWSPMRARVFILASLVAAGPQFARQRWRRQFATRRRASCTRALGAN